MARGEEIGAWCLQVHHSYHAIFVDQRNSQFTQGDQLLMDRVIPRGVYVRAITRRLVPLGRKHPEPPRHLTVTGPRLHQLRRG